VVISLQILKSLLYVSSTLFLDLPWDITSSVTILVCSSDRCIYTIHHVKYVLASALPWEIWDDRLNRQCITYMYILMNHGIATNTTGSHSLKNCEKCKLHHLYTTDSKYLPPVRTKISDVKLWRRIKNAWTIWITLFIECMVYVVPVSTCLWSCWRQTFWAYNVMMLLVCLMISETITASHFVAIQRYVKMYM